MYHFAYSVPQQRYRQTIDFLFFVSTILIILTSTKLIDKPYILFLCILIYLSLVILTPAQLEMNQSLGYQTLALLLHRKKSLLNSHILHLCMSLAGSGEARESSAIPNTPAFNDLLCDLEVSY